MPLFIKLAVTALVSALLLLGGIYTGEKLNPPTIVKSAQSFGSFTPVGGQTYTLSGSGVIASATTIPVTSFTTPDGRALVMSMFGTIGYAVLDPNSPSKIEDITFTGITQNANGSAILTGVSRGMDFVTPYMASTTLAQAHAGGSYLILSNSAGFYGQQFLFANSVSTSTVGIVMASTSPPYYDAEPIWANFTTEALASVAYVNSVVAGGAANASETVKGIGQLATAVQAALGTSLGSTGARLLLPASLATSTPYNSGTNVVPITGTTEKLAQGFWDLTQTYLWSGLHTFTAGIIDTASSTFNNTLNIAASSGKTLNLDNISYIFPSSQGSAGTVLGNNGSGSLSWGGVPHYTLTSNTAINVSGIAPQYATSTNVLNIPAGTLAASSSIMINGEIDCTQNSGASCTYILRDNTAGTTLATCTIAAPTSGTGAGSFRFIINNQSSLVSQKGYADCTATQTGNVVSSSIESSSSGSVTSAAFNTANALNLVLVASVSAGTSGGVDINEFSMVVNP